MIKNDDEYKTFDIICFDIKLSSKFLCTFFSFDVIYFLLLTRICVLVRGVVWYSMQCFIQTFLQGGAK